MKDHQQSTLAGTKTTPTDVCRWTQELFHLHSCLASRFARPEPHRRALKYLQGILSETARKNPRIAQRGKGSPAPCPVADGKQASERTAF
jgi:hypothetical protein